MTTKKTPTLPEFKSKSAQSQAPTAATSAAAKRFYIGSVLPYYLTLYSHNREEAVNQAEALANELMQREKTW